MEMLNWINKEMGPTGSMTVPVMRTVNGHKASDHSGGNTFGFWCKKSESMPGIQSNPKNRVPYDMHDAHFAIAAISVPAAGSNGVVFQASKAEEGQASELRLNNGQAQARWVDRNGHTMELTSPDQLAPNSPAVIALVSQEGSQQLRVNSKVADSGHHGFAPSVLTQLLIGWGFVNYYPQESFKGNVFSVVTGKGAPSDAEMAVLERYLASTAGASI
jgi:hypothetical protein